MSWRITRDHASLEGHDWEWWTRNWSLDSRSIAFVHAVGTGGADAQTDVEFRPTQKESHVLSRSDGGRAAHEDAKKLR